MNKRLAYRLAALSGLSIGGFLGGIAYERNRCNKLLDQSTNPYLLHASNDIKKVNKIQDK